MFYMKTRVKKTLILFIIGAFFHSASFALDGNGTENDPYRITSLADFDQFAGNSDYWDDWIRLDCDLNLTGKQYSTAVISPDTSTNDFYQGTTFSGNFNGNGHSIMNLYIDAGTTTNGYLGLFGQIGPNGVVENLSLENYVYSNCGTSTSGAFYIGALAGENMGTVKNCDIVGVVDARYCGYIGGVVGQNTSGKITDVAVYVNIQVEDYSGFVGGIAGVNGSLDLNATITKCKSSGTIQGAYDTNYMGGIVGTNWNYQELAYSIISNCESTCFITCGDNSDYLGGVVGHNWQNMASCAYSYANGDVKSGAGSKYIGGLCGANDEGLIFDCYATGYVEGYDRIGGLCGYNIRSGIYNCYSIGPISGTTNTGGFCGRQYGAGSEMRNCFWDSETSGMTVGYVLSDTSPGIIVGVQGKTTDQMFDPNTFLIAGWDYVEEVENGQDDNWRIPYQIGYPILHWEKDIPADYLGSYGVDLEDLSYLSDHWLANTDKTNEVLKIVASDASEGDYFGHSVCVSGDTLVVGAYGVQDSRGAAYLFDLKTGLQVQRLVSNDRNWGDRFGYSVGVDGDRVIVGAYSDDDEGLNFGSAYIFEVTTGTQITKLVTSDLVRNQNENFGYAVGISADKALVGAYGNDTAGSNAGAAYVFNANTGKELFKLTPSDSEAGDEFGYSLCVDGSVAVVGAPGNDDAGSNSGSAYIFDTITGAQLAKITASDATEGDKFGYSVSMDDKFIIVGAHTKDSIGCVYVFDHAGNQLRKLTPSDGRENQWFGISVAIEGNRAVIGSPGDSRKGWWVGSAYLFDIETGVEVSKFTASKKATADLFGYSVGLGNHPVVGAYSNDAYRGSVYLFDLDPRTDFEELMALSENWLAGITEDVSPPEPNPATFKLPPMATGQSSISMTANSGVDISNPVKYYFAELSGNPGGDDSGWQLSATYTDYGLDPNTQYIYTVQIKDSKGNTGTASNQAAVKTFSETEKPSDMIAYWSFDDSGNIGHDDSGNGNEGTAYNGPSSVTGIAGLALGLDGVDDYLLFTDEPLRITEDYSVNLWFSLQTANSQTQTLLTKYGYANGHVNYGLFLEEDQLKTVRHGSQDGTGGECNSVRSALSVTSVTANEWHMGTTVYDAKTQTVTLYLDGQFENSVEVAFPTNCYNWELYGYGPQPLVVGANKSEKFSDKFFAGTIDEVRVFDRLLSPAEIISLYHNP
ncbi:GLUG domain protein [Anaerohalosphaera lusitana]|uniref:GLUG domain protein n=1 Tax=Anaerohalosphaera lusitana TaxID=1936003 RepID=A0A1U9NQQ1_9BACT|nr:LamG-like jellyroll fold domain-containing protein [Anaerohalosphaera lusitana]AQT70064.1 GLUG domain protein [Anaerohalosphaera lusitana]